VKLDKYVLDTLHLYVDHKLPFLCLSDSSVVDSEPMPNYPIPQKLIEIKSGKHIQKMIYYRSKFMSPSFFNLRIFKSEYNNRQYKKYEDFVYNESLVIKGFIIHSALRN
jgi:hypothetical protein